MTAGWRAVVGLDRVPDLDSLALLLEVAARGSLGQAGAARGLSQPAVSARVQALERRVGLPLVARSPRGSRLTPAGALVADWAREVLSAAEVLAAGIDSFGLLATGAVGGVLSGLFAVGGEILMVPLLMSRAGLDQRRATAVSLVAIIPTALVGSLTYLLHGELDIPVALLLTVGAVVGAVIGSRLLRRILVAQLRWMFIAFLLLVALRLLLVAPHRGADVRLTAAVAVGYVGIGLVMGVSSGLFGIVGGIIAVPLLISLFAVSDLVAKGTALLVSAPTSAVGTVSNRRAGLVDVRAGLVVGVAAAVASIPAASLAVVLSPRLSRQLFAALLVLVAAQLVVKARRSRATG